MNSRNLRIVDLHFLFQWANSVAVDQMPEKGQLKNTKLAISRVNDNTCSLNLSSIAFEVLFMLFRVGGGNKHIVCVCISMVQPTNDLIYKNCAAFRNPEGILTNSNKLNGVVMAVVGMSCTGVLWYARTKSNLVKMVEPCKVAVKSCMWGMR